MSVQIQPMMAEVLRGEASSLPSGKYAIEPKYDGVRAQLHFTESGIRLFIGHSGNEADVRHMQHLNGNLPGVVLDGELFIPRSTLGEIVGQLHRSRPNRLRESVFMAFDILKVANQECMHLPWRERRELLEMVVSDHEGSVILSPVSYDIEDIDNFMRDGYEGAMLKHVEHPYVPGKRTRSWLKVKAVETVECFVTGWEPGKGGYHGMVGSLKMSVLDDAGREVEICSHGVFSEKFRNELTSEDGSLKKEWYGKVMEVSYQKAGTDLRLRHPRLLRVRDDRDASSCLLSQLGVEDAVLRPA